MKKLIILLSVLVTIVNVKAQNSAFPYPTLSQALHDYMNTGARFSVMENGVQGTFTVVDRGSLKQDSGIVYFKGTNQAAIRDTSQATGGFDLRWFGLTPGDTSAAIKRKNSRILNRLASDSVPYVNYVLKGGDFYFDSSWKINKYVKITGFNEYEMLDRGNMAKAIFPQSMTGVIINNNNASGYLIEGITISSTTPRSGRILEYNPNNGTALILAPYNPPITGEVYEVADAYYPDKLKGTFSLDDAGTLNLSFAINFTQPVGTFQIGDTLTGDSSNAKAVVRFVSRYYNAVVVSQISTAAAWNKKNEKIRGSISGASATLVNIPLPTSYRYAKIVHIATTTGNIDNTTDTSGIVTDTTTKDSTVYNTTGVLDTAGASGKRLNIFRKQGTYSVGILVQRRGMIRNTAVYGFGGDGIYVTNIAAPVTNANLVRIEYCKSSANVGSGVRINGGDANQVSIINSTFVADVAFAITNLSFLGINVEFCHTSSNLCGNYTSGNYLNRNDVWNNIYGEGGYVLYPYPLIGSYLAGGAVVLAGTWGGPNIVPYYRNDGYSGSWFDNKHLQNMDIYTDQTAGKRSVVFKGSGVTPDPVTVELSGTSGVGRGPAIRFRGPYGNSIGYEGVEMHPAAITYNKIRGVTNSFGGYSFNFEQRRNPPPLVTVTGGNGKGAFVYPNILNGKVISADVVTGGRSWPINGTTITIGNPTDTVLGHKAVLIPIVEDSVLTGVYVKDSGALYLDNDIVPVWEMASNGVFRNLLGNGTIGDATHPIVDAYITNLHTTAGAYVAPDSLVAKSATLGVPTSMLRLYNPGNSAPGRGATIDIFGPYGTGEYRQFASMQFLRDANYHSSFNLLLGDSTQELTSVIYASKLGQVGINTTAPDASAAFHVHSYTKGSIFAPRQTSAQLLAIPSPVGGLSVYNRQKQAYWYRDSINAQWVAIPKSDTTLVTDGSILIGTASTGIYKRNTITAGSGISITNGAGAITIAAATPTQLTATAAAGAGIVSLESLKATGNSGEGRGGSIDMESPLATGTSLQTARIATYWNNTHGSLGFYTGDNTAGLVERLHINGTGQISINTTAPATASTLFQVESGTGGSLPAPRVTSTQNNAIGTLTGGLLVFNRDKQAYRYYDSITGKWAAIQKSDTTTIADGMLAIGDAANNTFKRATLTPGTGGITITNSAGSITINNTDNVRTALFLGAKTRAQRDALVSPTAGSQIFNTDDNYPEYYNSFWGWMPVYASNEWQAHYGVEYFRNFYLNTNDNFLGTNTANGGGLNTSAAPTGSTAESAGSVNLSLTTNTNARSGFISSTGIVILGSGTTVFETRFQIPVLSTSTDRYQFLAGIMDVTTAVDQVDGVYLLYDEGGVSAGSTATGNWQLVTASNSGRTFTQTTSTAAINTWYTLREEINAAGTQANFYLNGTLLNASPVTTNIPTGLTRASGFGVMAYKSLGTTTRNVTVNYLNYKQKFATAR